MYRRLCAGLLGLAVLLAGCGGDAKPEASATPTAAPPPTVSSETGSIEGMVTDEEAVPLPGVTVALIEASLQQTSDAQGRFVFNNLTAGPHRLITEKLGFESVARAVDVRVGEVASVSFVLKAIEIAEEPFVSMVPYDGFLQCSVNPLYPINPCGSSAGADKDRFLFDVDTNYTLKNGVFELVFRPGSAATGSELELDVCDDLANEDVLCLDADWDHYTEGPSPVVLRVDDFPLKQQQRFLVGAGAPQNPPTPVLQQSFTIYVSLCYVQECAEDYSAVPA